LDYTTDATTGETTSGISTNLILEYMNQAQDHLQAAILATFPQEFTAEKTISMVGNQEEYTVPDRVFVNNKIVTVEYRSGPSLSDYNPLEPANFRDRDTSPGSPAFYIRRSGKILVNPIPQSTQGDIRVTFYRELDDLDIRRGTISSFTNTGTAITALTLSTTGDDELALAGADYLCVNDRYGTVTMYNIPVSSYSSTTGVVTLVGGSFTFVPGETISNGYYVTVGKYTTTHSKLTDNAERYIQVFAQKRLLQTDEANSSVEEDAELLKIEQDVMNSFADESGDVEWIPVLDEDITI
jgi:hypothetical protein